MKTARQRLELIQSDLLELELLEMQRAQELERLDKARTDILERILTKLKDG
jgi:hypothetical protein